VIPHNTWGSLVVAAITVGGGAVLGIVVGEWQRRRRR
jgi:hypothetical protein